MAARTHIMPAMLSSARHQETHPPLRTRRWLVAQAIILLGCLALYGIATFQVHQYEADVVRESFTIQGQIPLPTLRFRPAHTPLNVIVVIAHGYSANKEMMSAFGVDLAKQGVTVYAFDLPGHGASNVPYGGKPHGDVVAQLVTSVGEAVDYALAHAPAPAPKLALIGYSLGTIAVGEYALRHPELSSLTATVLVAGILQDHPTLSNPRNLLVLSGQFDLPGINDISTHLIASGCGVSPQAVSSAFQCDPLGLYTHRERLILPGLNHISIVTASSTHSAVIQWLGTYVDGRIGAVSVNADVRLHWLLLGFMAAAFATLPLLALGSALLGLARTARPASTGAEQAPLGGPAAIARLPMWAGMGLFTASLAMGLLVLHALLPQSFWAPSPMAFLAQQVSADVAMYLLITGAFLLGGLWAVVPLRARLNAAVWTITPARLAIAAAVAAFLYFTLGSLSSFAWEGLTLYPARLWRAGVYAVLIWPFFFAVQALLSAFAAWGPWRAALRELATTLLLLAAFIAAIATNFDRLSYLGILLPVFAIVLIALVGFNAWARTVVTRPEALLATTETLVLAWALAATLPLIG